VPAALLSLSSFLVVVKTSILRSTYICPVANSAATTVPTLQFFGFLIDCVVVQAVYRLVDDAISPADDWTIHLQDGTSNLLLVGLTLIVRDIHSLLIISMLTPPGFISRRTRSRHGCIPRHARAPRVDALISF
jgi:hypothetical protein